MSKAIRFTKAEMEAVQRSANHWEEVLRFMGMQPGNAKVQANVTKRALDSLLAKMQAASLPSPSPIAPDAASTGGAVPDSPSAGAFCRSFDAVFPGGAIWPDTPKNWRMMNDMVVKHQTLSSDTAGGRLAASVKKWAKRPISWRTLLDKGGEWIRNEQMKGMQAAPAMFHLPQEDDE